eukprot:241891-Prymnesium_polylepis.1
MMTITSKSASPLRARARRARGSCPSNPPAIPSSPVVDYKMDDAAPSNNSTEIDNADANANKQQQPSCWPSSSAVAFSAVASTTGM